MAFTYHVCAIAQAEDGGTAYFAGVCDCENKIKSRDDSYENLKKEIALKFEGIGSNPISITSLTLLDDVSLSNNTNSYLLFAGDDCYPVGGARDFIGIFESMEKAIEKHNPSIYRDQGWANIFSLKSLQIVKKFYHGEWYLPDDEI